MRQGDFSGSRRFLRLVPLAVGGLLAGPALTLVERLQPRQHEQAGP